MSLSLGLHMLSSVPNVSVSVSPPSIFYPDLLSFESQSLAFYESVSLFEIGWINVLLSLILFDVFLVQIEVNGTLDLLHWIETEELK